MRKKLIGTLVLALALAWGGTAMAQQADVAPCGLGDFQHALTFPFFAKTDTFWAGFGLMNTSREAIPAENICFVGRRASDGQYVQTKGDQLMGAAGGPFETGDFKNGLPGNSNFAATMQMLGDVNPIWLDRTYMAVYVNGSGTINPNATARANALRGYGMSGDGKAAQGYLALTRNCEENPGAACSGDTPDGNNAIYFDYIPRQNTWPAGLAIANDLDATRTVNCYVYYEGGGINPVQHNIQIGAQRMAVNVLENMFPGFRLDQRAQIRCYDSAGGGRLHGFAFFSDGMQGQGLLPVYSNEPSAANQR